MPKEDPNWGRLASVGLEVAVGVGVGVVVGSWFDRKYHHDPWGILTGAGLGLAGGLYLLIKETLRANKD
ncbi:MAG: AtpZ/AtpI family protein [Planctomycetota bacterium]|nr:AtpZ/AtpI family protein [Planctomycetota bacterium]